MMFYFPEIVPKNVYDCCKRDHEGELYVIMFVDMKGKGGGTGGGGALAPPQKKNQTPKKCPFF